jgi:ABC-type Fe3+-hydroxamate transport system substrate-binding protein
VKVVSLVPSSTETLLALGVTPVACTRFCEQPAIPHVGGTKDPDVEKIGALAPDLVVVNDEENRIEDVEALRGLGLRLHEMSPRSVEEVGPAVVALAHQVRVGPTSPFDRWDEWLDHQRRQTTAPCRQAFVPVWRRPWMTLAADTYGSSILALLGWRNVFADAAERYPSTTLAEAAARRPDAAFLPTEPYPFKQRHAAEVADAVDGAVVRIIDGQDLFWWGARTPGAANRLRRQLPR